MFKFWAALQMASMDEIGLPYKWRAGMRIIINSTSTSNQHQKSMALTLADAKVKEKISN
jgi:hypothetical protein